MTEIAIQVIMSAESQHRESALRQYQWRVQRKAELEEEERKRRLEAERPERERQRRIEQGRIKPAFSGRGSISASRRIRKYVEAIRLAQAGDRESSIDEFEQWRKWELAQADRIDPAIGGRFLNAIEDEDAS